MSEEKKEDKKKKKQWQIPLLLILIAINLVVAGRSIIKRIQYKSWQNDISIENVKKATVDVMIDIHGAKRKKTEKAKKAEKNANISAKRQKIYNQLMQNRKSSKLEKFPPEVALAKRQINMLRHNIENYKFHESQLWKFRHHYALFTQDNIITEQEALTLIEDLSYLNNNKIKKIDIF